MSNELSVLSVDECVGLLSACDVGRIAVVDEAGYPAVFPISYCVVPLDGESNDADVVIMLRTRPENVIDRPGEKVALQIDGVDAGHDGGWSVLVRGVLAVAEPDARLDSHPLLDDNRDAWRMVVPTRITGRRLHGDVTRWSFHPLGYV